MIIWPIFFFFSIVRCEVYTALSDLEEVLQTEHHLIKILDNYIRTEEEKLNALRRYTAFYRSQQDRASENIQLYVANPLNAYSLVKRLTTDWTEVEDLISKNISSDCVANMTRIKTRMKFPTNEDLTGAAVAIARLQDTYRLDTSSLARGEINGKKYSSELSVSDCFELGRQFFNIEDYYHCQLWMTEADSRSNEEVNQRVNRSDILEYLAFSTYRQGNISLALHFTNELLELMPTHSKAVDNKLSYEEELNNLDVELKSQPETSTTLSQYGSYEPLCRSEISLPIEKSSKLICGYLTKTNPFLLIAPFKVEEAHHNPDIFIFHDVLSDNEIATIKRLAQPRFRRATIQSIETGKLEFVNYRISKSAWLSNMAHKHVEDVSRRVNDMTGLSMDTAESLQVVNYGIGGQYEPHFDFAKTDQPNAFSDSEGNRIATVLFYMSDVEQGGATVFTNINVTLWPHKGAAAFWYNLHPSGDGDKMTEHAACPVLIGSKWVSNLWIHERGQEFLRPCLLERPSEDLVE